MLEVRQNDEAYGVLADRRTDEAIDGIARIFFATPEAARPAVLKGVAARIAACVRYLDRDWEESKRRAAEENARMEAELEAEQEDERAVWMHEVLELCGQGRKLEAIKLLRIRSGLGLKEAADAVRAMTAEVQS